MYKKIMLLVLLGTEFELWVDLAVLMLPKRIRIRKIHSSLTLNELLKDISLNSIFPKCTEIAWEQWFLKNIALKEHTKYPFDSTIISIRRLNTLNWLFDIFKINLVSITEFVTNLATKNQIK